MLSHASEPMDVRQGPEAVIGRALEMVGKLRAADTAPGFAGAGAGVPGPVSFAEGLPVSPQIHAAGTTSRSGRPSPPSSAARCWSTTT